MRAWAVGVYPREVFRRILEPHGFLGMMSVATQARGGGGGESEPEEGHLASQAVELWHEPPGWLMCSPCAASPAALVKQSKGSVAIPQGDLSVVWLEGGGQHCEATAERPGSQCLGRDSSSEAASRGRDGSACLL